MARSLPEVFAAFDGAAELTPRPTVIADDRVSELIGALIDPTRRGLIFVAGSDSRFELPAWTEHVATLTKDTVGLSATYVLTPSATRAFYDRVGQAHAVTALSVRSFVPGVDLDRSVDALKHRVLPLDRILKQADLHLSRQLGQRARDVAIETPLATGVMRVNRLLEQAIDQLLVRRPGTSVAPTPVSVVKHGSPADLGADANALAALIRDVLGVEKVNAKAIQSIRELAIAGKQIEQALAAVAGRLEEFGYARDALEEQRDRARRQVEDEQLAHAETMDDLMQAEAQVRNLRAKLLDAGRHEDAWEVAEPSSHPESYVELIEFMAREEGIEFTGDEDALLSLEASDPLFRKWGLKIWNVVGALVDYVRVATTVGGIRGVEGYLLDPPSGCRVYSANRHARDESADVHKNDRFRRSRVLPVPIEVDKSGEVFMGAHFKISQDGLAGPRLHYYDDAARTGLVYIGYIGKHLPTKQTN